MSWNHISRKLLHMPPFSLSLLSQWRDMLQSVIQWDFRVFQTCRGQSRSSLLFGLLLSAAHYHMLFMERFFMQWLILTLANFWKIRWSVTFRMNYMIKWDICFKCRRLFSFCCRWQSYLWCISWSESLFVAQTWF